jgi:hypothetical protein
MKRNFQTLVVLHQFLNFGFPFILGAAEGCYSFEPIKACVIWSVEPAQGARIAADAGTLTIDKATPHNSIFIVKANVEDGRRVVSTKVRVFTREANPLVGRWAQTLPVTSQGDEIRGLTSTLKNSSSKPTARSQSLGDPLSVIRITGVHTSATKVLVALS